MMNVEFRYLYKYVPKKMAKEYHGARKEHGAYTVKAQVEKIPYGVVAIMFDENEVDIGISVCNSTKKPDETGKLVGDQFSKAEGRTKALHRLVNSASFYLQLEKFPKAVQRDIISVIYGIRRGKY